MTRIRYPVGIVVNDDFRDPLTRWLDRHRTSPAHPWRAIDGEGCQWAVLPPEPFSGWVFGATGSGKSVLLQRIINAALTAGWNVALIDAKGTTDDAQTSWLPLARRNNALFEWTHNDERHASRPYDLWRGNSESLVSKALRLLPPPSTDAQHYRDQNERALRALVGHGGGWRTTDELVAKLERPSDYVTDQRALTTLKSDHIARDTSHKYDNLARALDGLTAADGWAWDDFDDADLGLRFALVSIERGHSEAALRLGQALLADLDSYRASRRPLNARPPTGARR